MNFLKFWYGGTLYACGMFPYFHTLRCNIAHVIKSLREDFARFGEIETVAEGDLEKLEMNNPS